MRRTPCCDVCHKPIKKVGLLSPSISGPRQMHPDCDPKLKEVSRLYFEWIKQAAKGRVWGEERFKKLRVKAKRII